MKLEKIPTEQEINQLLDRANKLREVRNKAKKFAMATFAELAEDMDVNDSVALMKLLQARIVGKHKKVRGSRVGPQLKQALVDAIKSGHYSNGDMATMFNLSISYISNVKRELKDAGEIARNVYTDRPLKHHKKEDLVPA